MFFDLVSLDGGRTWVAEVYSLQTGELFHATKAYTDRAKARGEALVWITAQGRIQP